MKEKINIALAVDRLIEGNDRLAIMVGDQLFTINGKRSNEFSPYQTLSFDEKAVISIFKNVIYVLENNKIKNEELK